MKITILSFGTRGDIQPLIALALGLQTAGHQVVLGADSEFEPWITSYGVKFGLLRLNLRQFLNTAAGQAAMSGEKEAPAESFDTLVRPLLDDAWQLAQGSDLLIYDTMLTAAYHIAQKLNIPAVMTSVMPNMTPTREFPLLGAPKVGWGGWGNKLSYQLYRLAWFLAYGDISRWTQDTLGLKPKRWQNYWFLHGRRLPIVYSYSTHVLPRPADWPPETFAGGYWFVPDLPYTPPAELAQFLAAGEPPLYLGFGSVVGGNPQKMTELVVTALEKVGYRTVLASGWGGLNPQTLPPHIHLLSAAPHEWLFPQMKAVVHHGGAGTTAAGLRFGKPSLLCPFVTDQFLWGQVVHQRGWGPAPIPQKELTVEKLAQALEELLSNKSYPGRVQDISHLLQTEPGVQNAVDFIHSCL